MNSFHSKKCDHKVQITVIFPSDLLEVVLSYLILAPLEGKGE